MTRVWEVVTGALVVIWAAAAWKAAFVTSAWWALAAIPLTAFAALLLVGVVLVLQERREAR